MPRSEAAREANKNRSRAWYHKNKDTKVRERIERNHRIMDEARKVPCVDCGGTFPVCAMQFDHVRGEKTMPVARMRSVSEARLRAEIAKCEVRCANCHSIRTWGSNARYAA